MPNVDAISFTHQVPDVAAAVRVQIGLLKADGHLLPPDAEKALLALFDEGGDAGILEVIVSGDGASRVVRYDLKKLLFGAILAVGTIGPGWIAPFLTLIAIDQLLDARVVLSPPTGLLLKLLAVRHNGAAETKVLRESFDAEYAKVFGRAAGESEYDAELSHLERLTAIRRSGTSVELVESRTLTFNA